MLLPEANGLAYLSGSISDEEKSFVALRPGAIVINLFTSVIYECLYYAEAIFLVVCDPSMNEL